jgi:hypothetical protein
MRERGQRLLAVERGGRWNPLVEQCIGELVHASGPAAHDAVELRAHHEVSHAKLAVRGDSGRVKDVTQLFASQMSATLQCAQERVVASPESGVVEPQRKPRLSSVNNGRLNRCLRVYESPRTVD